MLQSPSYPVDFFWTGKVDDRTYQVVSWQIFVGNNLSAVSIIDDRGVVDGGEGLARINYGLLMNQVGECLFKIVQSLGKIGMECSLSQSSRNKVPIHTFSILCKFAMPLQICIKHNKY